MLTKLCVISLMTYACINSYQVHTITSFSSNHYCRKPMNRLHTTFGSNDNPRKSKLLKSISSPPSIWETIVTPIKDIWDFSRPHTVMGSGLSILCLFMFATPPSLWFTKKFNDSLLKTLVPSLAMNLYITGLNQITDIDIDKINKPYLPIASGAISKRRGIVVVIIGLIIAILSSLGNGWPLLTAVIGSGILGTMYSLPPFRLKRFPLLAALCILVVRGSLINMGFFLQAKSQILNLKITSIRDILDFPESIIVTLFFAAFGTVIALMKDVPDIQGDFLFKIRSFSVRLGAAKMFRISWHLLFGLIFATSLSLWGLFIKSVVPFFTLLNQPQSILRIPISSTIISRGLVALIGTFISYDIQSKAKKIQPEKPENSKEVFEYYMYVWNIFYACYALLAFIR